jgi:hypothetical protein
MFRKFSEHLRLRTIALYSFPAISALLFNQVICECNAGATVIKHPVISTLSHIRLHINHLPRTIWRWWAAVDRPSPGVLPCEFPMAAAALHLCFGGPDACETAMDLKGV